MTVSIFKFLNNLHKIVTSNSTHNTTHRRVKERQQTGKENDYLDTKTKADERPASRPADGRLGSSVLLCEQIAARNVRDFRF